MKRTSATSLVILGIIGAVATLGFQFAVVSSGGARYEPQLALPVAMLAIAAIIVALAVPVWRTTRGSGGARVDPFHATRVVLLAKASALAGGLLVGAAVGLVIYLFIGPAAITGGSVLMALAALGGAVALLAAGLVAEYLCTVPPDDRDDDRRPPGPETIAR